MASITPDTKIESGSVIVRVGADALDAPRGPRTTVFPVVQLIWPSDEPQPFPNVPLTIRWQDKLEATRPSSSPNPKYVGLVMPDGRQWLGYRVSEMDRQLFQSLHRKWKMWFLRVSRQGDDEERSYTMYDGDLWNSGTFMDYLDEAVREKDAGELQRSLLSAWNGAVAALRDSRPDLLPDQESIHIRSVLISKVPHLLEELGGGKLPWPREQLPYWGKPDLHGHDYAVKNYIAVTKGALDSANAADIGEKWRSECADVYKLLRRAKIFEIAPEAYAKLHVEVDRYVTEEIAHLTFRDPREGHVDIPDAESALLLIRQTEAVASLPFPAKMPFDVCYFALTGLLELSEHQAFTRGLSVSDGQSYTILGIVATADGGHYEIFAMKARDPRSGGTAAAISMIVHRVPEKNSWLQSTLCLAPFILHFIVDCINDHQTTVLAQRRLGFQSQGKLRKGLKDLGAKNPIPPPFYTVYLRDAVIKEVAKGYRGGKLRSKPAHRFDVRGHWCFKIYRGKMPMDAELELHLEKLNYAIFKDRPMDAWVREALIERGQSLPANGEWIAVKRFWKNSYVKGPDDAEYVPSTRKATKGPLSIDNADHPELKSKSSHVA